MNRGGENKIAFFLDASDGSRTVELRLRRTLALAGQLAGNNRICFFCPSGLSDQVKKNGFACRAIDYRDVHAAAHQVAEFAPDITVFDLEKAPLVLATFVKGSGSLTVGFANGQEQEPSFFDIHIPTDTASPLGLSAGLAEAADIIQVVKKLSWDSEFFGFPVAFLSCLHLNPAIVRFVFDFCRAHAIKLLEYQCDCHDRQSVLLAEKHGFNFADIRMTFERDLSATFPAARFPDGFSLDTGSEADIPRLMEIADGLYLHSRYFFDTNFCRDKVRIFYQDWVRKAVTGSFDDQIFVLRDPSGPAGFCTIKYGDGGAARIRLVGLDPAFAGKNLGQVLLTGTLQQLVGRDVRYAQVVTQGRNYAAQRLYQRCGFITRKTELWYHKWFLEDEIFHV